MGAKADAINRVGTAMLAINKGTGAKTGALMRMNKLFDERHKVIPR